MLLLKAVSVCDVMRHFPKLFRYSFIFVLACSSTLWGDYVSLDTVAKEQEREALVKEQRELRQELARTINAIQNEQSSKDASKVLRLSEARKEIRRQLRQNEKRFKVPKASQVHPLPEKTFSSELPESERGFRQAQYNLRRAESIYLSRLGELTLEERAAAISTFRKENQLKYQRFSMHLKEFSAAQTSPAELVRTEAEQSLLKQLSTATLQDRKRLLQELGRLRQTTLTEAIRIQPQPSLSTSAENE